MAKYLLYAVTAALLLALGWPSHGIPLLLFFGFVPILFMEHRISGSENTKRKGWKIFGYAYLAFLIWNAIVVYWLHNAQEMGADGQFRDSWISYLFPVFANALLMSLTFQIYHKVKNRIGLKWGLLFLPAIWMCFEKFHLSWEMTWPWFNLGNGFANYPQWIQWYEYTGTFGGTLWILSGNILVFYFLRLWLETKKKEVLKKLILYPLILILVPIGISYLIYYTYEEKGEEIEVLILQPELDPYYEKYNKDPWEITADLVRLTDENIQPGTQFVVAPETAFPGPGTGLNVDDLNNDYLIQELRLGFAKYPEMTFVSGVELMRFYPYEQMASETASRLGRTDMWVDVMNAGIQLNFRDSIQHYYKSKLVVGVEHFPYMKILKPLLGDIMLNYGGTVRTHLTQEKRSVFRNSFNDAVIGPLICYESIYGEFTTGYVKEGANVLFIMTNDSWWGESDGHRQLLQLGNLRAIESRRDLVRSANSGISAFVNQKGEITSSLPYGIQGALSGKAKLNEKITFYVKYGDWLFRIALPIMVILLLMAIAKPFWRRRERHS